MPTATYAEEHGYPIEEWLPDGLHATRKLRCAWGDRYTIRDAFMDQEYTLISGTGARCARVSVMPAPGQNKGALAVASYREALVTCEFEVGGPETVDLLSESIEPSGEFYTLPNGDGKGNYYFSWTGGAAGEFLSPDETPGVLIRSIDYTITKYRVATVPTSAYSLVGNVNDAAIHPKTSGLTGWTFAAETLLFHGPRPDRTIKSDGTFTWTVAYRFTYRPNGWNKFPRATGVTLGWESIYLVGGAEFKPYVLADFSVL